MDAYVRTLPFPLSKEVGTLHSFERCLKTITLVDNKALFTRRIGRKGMNKKRREQRKVGRMEGGKIHLH